jgi:hypothetical protein
MFLSTLSGLNGNKPLTAYAAVIFLFVNAFSLAGLYRDVKCSCRLYLHLLERVVQPGRDRLFKGAKTLTPLGWSL